MSIESWQPQQAAPSLNKETLNIYIELGDAENVLQNCINLSEDIVDNLQTLKTNSMDFWTPLLSDLMAEDIHNLIRFFVVVEEHQSSFFAGNDSPVIAFNKVLKKRKEPLSKEFLLWIKNNTSNQFIPNGSIF